MIPLLPATIPGLVFPGVAVSYYGLPCRLVGVRDGFACVAYGGEIGGAETYNDVPLQDLDLQLDDVVSRFACGLWLRRLVRASALADAALHGQDFDEGRQKQLRDRILELHNRGIQPTFRA